MPVVMMVDNSSGGAELNDKVRAELGQDRAAGGTVHIAGPSPGGGFRVIEVWESEEQAKRFIQERFRPALEAVVPVAQRPDIQFWPVHNYMT